MKIQNRIILKRTIKRTVAIFTAFVLLVGLVPIRETKSYGLDAGYWSDRLKSEGGSTSSEARNWLKRNLGAQFNSNGETREYQINIGILRDFRKIVYTPSHHNYYGYEGIGPFTKGEDSKYHYKYLGYTKDEKTKVTNPHYINVSGTTNLFSNSTNTNYRSKNWITDSDNKDTWKVVKKEQVREFMLTDKGIKAQDGGVLSPLQNLSVKDILSHRPNTQGVSGLANYAKFQTLSTLKYWGSVRLSHNPPGSGKTYYRTIDINPIDFPKPVLTVTPDKPLYTFKQDETAKTIGATATLTFSGYQKLKGWELEDYIQEAEITLNGVRKTERPKGNTISAHFDLLVTRDMFKVGTPDIYPLNATAKINAANLFGDVFICQGKSSTAIMIAKGEVEPDFVIKNKDEDVTDSIISYENFKDINLVLEPKNIITGQNKIEKVYWQLLGPSATVDKYGNNPVSYPVTEKSLKELSKDGRLNFAMTIVTKYPFSYGDKKDITTLTINHHVDFEKIDKEATLPDKKYPPSPRLRVPKEVRRGDVFTYSAKSSYDKDGFIETYDFSAKDHRLVKALDEEGIKAKITLMSKGLAEATMQVTDNDNLSRSVTKNIQVLPAIEAKMNIMGKRKVNRKITLTAKDSPSSHYFPIDSYSWEITPLEGQKKNSIKHAGSLSQKQVDILFKEPGAYDIKLKLKAKCTYEGDEDLEENASVHYPIRIKEDLAPVADLQVMSLSLRDKMDSQRATIEMANASYSKDNDPVEIKWYYTFDKNNDKGLVGEPYTLIKGTSDLEKIKVGHVGDYYIYNTVREIIPEEDTIKAFLTEEDYKKDTSLDEPLSKRKCKVDNVAPVVSTSATLKKQVDLLVVTNEDQVNRVKLLSEINRLTKELFERKILLNVNIKQMEHMTSEKETAGVKTEYTYDWHRYVNWIMKWQYYYKYVYGNNGDYEIYGDPTRKQKVILETRKGTDKQARAFPVYKDAYGVKKSKGNIHYNGSNTRYSVSADIYNGPLDFLKNVGSYEEQTYYEGSRSEWILTNNRSYCNEDFKYYGDDGYKYPSDDESYPQVNITVDKSFKKGKALSSEQKPYTITKLQALIDTYKNSKNDKYLIFALKDADEFFIPVELKKKIENYGFKVYFSVDDYWGEFTPKVPKAVGVKFENDALYAQTAYGNHLKNQSKEADKKMPYQYLRKEEELVDYENKNILSLFTPLGEKNTGSVNLASLGESSIYPFRAWEYERYDDRASLTYEGEEHPHVEVETTLSNTISIIDKPRFSKTLVANGTIKVQDQTLEVKGIYNMDHESAIVKTKDESLYLVSGRFNSSDGEETFVKTRIPAKNIESVHGFSQKNTWLEYYHRFQDNPENQWDKLYVSNTIVNEKHTVYVIKTRNQGYYVCFLTYDISDMKNKKIVHNVVPITSLSQLSYSQFSAPIDEAVIRGADAKWYIDGFEGDDPYSNLSRYVGSFPFSGMGTVQADFQYFTLVSNKGELYENGVKVYDSGVLDADVHISEKEKMFSYVSDSGEVYARGHCESGQFGGVSDLTHYARTFTSPYRLNSNHRNKNFSCIFDITSKTPAFLREERGAYKPIADEILKLYSDYKTIDKKLIVVGDTVDISGYVIDYEDDPIMKTQLRASHNPYYFDNSMGIYTPPEDYKKPVKIDKSGQIDLRIKAKDNPVGEDDRFREYRYENKDNTITRIIAHRRPVAKLGYALVPQGNGAYNFVSKDASSFDLDHTSRFDKGIIEKEFYYREGLDPKWHLFDGTKRLKQGVQYYFALRVKDLEKAWSDYDIKPVKLEGEPFILDGFISPAYPEPVPAGNTIKITAETYIYKNIKTVTALVDNQWINLYKTKENGMQKTYEASYKIPESKKDKDYYEVLIKAIATDESTREKHLKLNVQTPPQIKGIVSPKTIKRTETLNLTAYTNDIIQRSMEEPVPVKAVLFKDTPDEKTVFLYESGYENRKRKWTSSTTVDTKSTLEGQVVYFYGTSVSGKTAMDTDTFTLIQNSPPTVNFTGHEPNSVYEGDNVKLTFAVDDPDKDPLEVVYTYSVNGGSRKPLEIHKNVRTPNQEVITIKKPKKDTLEVKAVVKDPSGETAQASAVVNIYPLTVKGHVNHVDKWNENRINFNRSKTGTDNKPRGYEVFWSGEKFVLRAKTTDIDKNNPTVCKKVHVKILGEPYETNLGTKDGVNWEKELWHEDMFDWKSGERTFHFRSYYTNGTVKVDDITITIDNYELYWRGHKAF